MDCLQHGPGSGAELFIIEGDSAASTVGMVRDALTQAEHEYRATSRDLRSEGVDDIKAVRYRGLAGLDQYTLSATCLQPDTRVLRPLGRRDALVALAIFGGPDPDVDLPAQRRFEF